MTSQGPLLGQAINIYFEILLFFASKVDQFLSTKDIVSLDTIRLYLKILMAKESICPYMAILAKYMAIIFTCIFLHGYMMYSESNLITLFPNYCY